MDVHLIDTFKDKLLCPHCQEEHNVNGGQGGFQTEISCSACKNPFGVVAIPHLKFQTVMILEPGE